MNYCNCPNCQTENCPNIEDGSISKTGTIPVYNLNLEQESWPNDPMFYLVSSTGNYICRNHQFFRSCVKTTKPVKALPEVNESVHLSYPKLSRQQIEQIVGWFTHVGKKHSEAIVLLCWDNTNNRLELAVPVQEGSDWMDLKYTTPNLPPSWTVIGDIHSHVDCPAYTSFVDERDELHRPGLHIVVGKISQEPPEFHVAVTVDGSRFTVKDWSQVIEDYGRRSKQYPREWNNQITIRKHTHPWYKPWERDAKKADKEYEQWLEARTHPEYLD